MAANIFYRTLTMPIDEPAVSRYHVERKKEKN